MRIFYGFATIYTILRVERISQAFKTAFTGIINSYARELGILKDKDANFNGADVRNGMTAVVSVKHPDLDSRVRQRQSLTIRMQTSATAKVTNDEVPLYFDKNLES